MVDAEEEIKKLSMAKRIRDEGEAMLAKRGLDIGTTVLPPKEPTNLQGENVSVKTNFFKLDVQKAITIYQYRMEIRFKMVNREGVDKSFISSDTSKLEGPRRLKNIRLSRSAFDLLVQRNTAQFPKRERLYYDGGNLLFSLDNLKFPQAEHTVTVNAADCEAEFRSIHERATAIEIKFSTIEDQVRLFVPPDLTHVRTEDCGESRLYLQFLDLVTTEHAVNTGNYVAYDGGLCYLMDPTAHGYNPQDFPVFDFGAYLAVGVKKSIRMIGDSPTSAVPALVIDLKSTPFHGVGLVSDKVLQMFPNIEQNINGSFDRVKSLLLGLYVSAIHLGANPRLEKIIGLTTENATQKHFELNGVETSVADYFIQRHGRALQHPNLPLLVTKSRGSDNYLPMEYYEVVDDQPVSANQITPDMQQKVLRACTRLPSALLQEINRNGSALRLSDSPYLHEANITVNSQPIEVQGRVLNAPAMIYQDLKNLSIYDFNKGNWRPGQRYSVPGNANVWAIYAMESTGPVFRDEQSLRQYCNVYLAECHLKGIQMGEPADCRVLQKHSQSDHSIPTLEETFSEAEKHGCKFIMLITTKSDKNIHDVLKKYEQMHGIVTQNVTVETAKAAAGIGTAPKRLTMENIVNKTNMKLGGLNYQIGDLASQQFIGNLDLFIGIATNHPAGGFGLASSTTEPSVVGFAANDLKETIAFSGDFVYQEARREEKVHVIETVVKQCIQRFKEHRGRKPERIFLYRNGCSEGQFELILKYEVSLVRGVVKQLSEGSKLAVIVPNKIHNVRLIPSRLPQSPKAIDQNLKPGTMVDSGIVHPYYNEFYLLGHLGRLGTAKIPRYTIVHNPDGITCDDIKLLTYYLAFGHQIITSTSGLPSPVYIAEEMAKRGRNIYKAHSSGSELRNVNGNNGRHPSADSSPASANSVSFADANTRYTYSEVKLAADGTPMRNLRFNA